MAVFLTFKIDSQTILTPLALMLTFDKVPSTSPAPVNQIVWRLASVQVNEAPVQFEGVMTTEAEVLTGLERHRRLQQTMKLVTSDAGVEFTTPSKGVAVAIGTIDPNGSLEPVFVWQDVADTLSVEMVITPDWKGYVTFVLTSKNSIQNIGLVPGFMQHYTLAKNPNGSYSLTAEYKSKSGPQLTYFDTTGLYQCWGM